jgi:hypothetical protein
MPDQKFDTVAFLPCYGKVQTRNGDPDHVATG